MTINDAKCVVSLITVKFQSSVVDALGVNPAVLPNFIRLWMPLGELKMPATFQRSVAPCSFD
jgi:hypothetical protein